MNLKNSIVKLKNKPINLKFHKMRQMQRIKKIFMIPLMLVDIMNLMKKNKSVNIY